MSHPAETMIGLAGAGENRTHDTHSECPSGSPIVYLHSPIVFHSLIVRSRDPDTICRLSTENATDSTSLAWPRKRRVVAPVARSHRRRVPSQEPDSANWPSDDSTASCTKWECPRRERRGTPYAPSSRVRVHTMSVLSREAERRRSDAGSRGAARAVTQPAWPSRVPRRERVSVMVKR